MMAFLLTLKYIGIFVGLAAMMLVSMVFIGGGMRSRREPKLDRLRKTGL